MIRPLIASLLLVSLTACGGGDDHGTSISVKTGNGNAASANVDGSTGKVAVDLPGFKGELNLPELALDAGDIDLNGVKLFPGSTVRDLGISSDGNGTGNPDGTVRIAFDSPAAADEVRQWFQGRLTAAGYTLKSQGNGLVGTTEEGAAFKLDMTPGGDGQSQGTITIAG